MRQIHMLSVVEDSSFNVGIKQESCWFVCEKVTKHFCQEGHMARKKKKIKRTMMTLP